MRPSMKKWLMIFLCMVHMSAMAKENMQATFIQGTLAFPTNVIPLQAAVVVYCTFDFPIIQSEEFYAYVTPYVGTFNDIQLTQALYGQVSIGSKVYMPSDARTRKISIIGVTQSNEAIMIDLTNMPAVTTVTCEF